MKNGRTVRVHYKGTLADGTIFDSTDGMAPLAFVVGSGTVIHGFDEAVRHMEAGESCVVTIPCTEAYGEYDDSKIETSPMYALPNAKDIEVGKLFYFVTSENLKFPARVLEINEGIARIDFNHPLAGKDLTFEIHLLEEVEV
jgi:peptidylprolyl isomerase